MNDEWDSYREEDDPTYQRESTVFSRLHPEHEAYKPHKRAGYNPKAEHDYSLSYRPDGVAENSKFIKEIATADIDKTKLPHNVGKYNGLTNPDDHLQFFNGAGVTGGWNLPTWCHLFAQTFVGAARVWFDSLPAGRIKSWIDFRDKFLAHFSQQRRHTRDPADCLNIWRKDHESVEDFITRYNKECLEIGYVGKKMMRAHFMRVVKCDDLIKRLKGRDGGPKDWETFIEAAKTIARTDKQLTGDDNRQYNHNDRRNKKGKGQSWKTSSYKERSPTRNTINQIAHRKEVKRENREKQWTPLTKTPSEVLSTENHQFKPPLQMRNKRDQDQNLFCEFHKDIGHLTGDCFSLKQKIERALRDGRLTHLVKGGNHDNRQFTEERKGQTTRSFES
ncbi:putative retrotransposon gag domain-containing protein [Helianthus anomalus]